jgi:hypothetical protein
MDGLGIAAETRRWAHVYADLGWRVFPVVRGAKRPIYRGWQADATVDHDRIDRWWRRDPAPSIGIVTGEAFVAFDIESTHLDVLRAWLEGQPAPLPSTPIARTGRGGIHILARAPSLEAGRDLVLDGVHLGELKARGGFIVAAPSVTTGAYGWLRSPDEVGVANAPAWLLALAPARPRRPLAAACGRTIGVAEGQWRLAGLARTVAHAPEGHRNDLLYWATRRALEAGIPVGVAASVMSRVGRGVGLTEREVDATVHSAITAHGR